jgi:hypothetical protein
LDITSTRTPDECYLIYTTSRQLIAKLSEKIRLLQQKLGRWKERDRRSSRLVMDGQAEKGLGTTSLLAYLYPSRSSKEHEKRYLSTRKVGVEERFRHEPRRAARRHGDERSHTRAEHTEESQANEPPRIDTTESTKDLTIEATQMKPTLWLWVFPGGPELRFRPSTTFELTTLPSRQPQ